jgi:hypothetical protein
MVGVFTHNFSDIAYNTSTFVITMLFIYELVSFFGGRSFIGG